MPTLKELQDQLVQTVPGGTYPVKTSGYTLEALKAQIKAAQLSFASQEDTETSLKELSAYYEPWHEAFYGTVPAVAPPIPGHIGITSKLANGKHIIMWDFDGLSLGVVSDTVVKYGADSAANYIVQTSEDAKHFHVYCFSEVTELCTLASCDTKHFEHSKTLGFSTLRITPKNGFAPRVVSVVLKGTIPEIEAQEVPLTALTSFIVYSAINPYSAPHTETRFEIGAHDLSLAMKFLSQLEQAQKTKEVPSV